MRDRLIDLLEQAKTEALGTMGSLNNGFGAWYADRILEDGWIRPPCKIGDVVYAVGESKIVECVCHEITLHNELMITTAFKCDYDCEGCPFESWAKDYCGEYSCQGEYGDWFFSVDDFGKIVFRTKEEAEQALKGSVE